MHVTYQNASRIFCKIKFSIAFETETFYFYGLLAFAYVRKPFFTERPVPAPVLLAVIHLSWDELSAVRAQ